MDIDIQTHIRQRNIVRLRRKIGKHLLPSIDGYILSESERFVVLYAFRDFIFDGIVIVRKKHISSIQYDDAQSYYDYILRREGLMPKQRLALSLDISSLTTICQDLQRIKAHIILEGEHPKKTDFWIGTIQQVKYKKVYFKSYDAQGYWTEEPIVVPFKDISSIKIDDPYVRTFSRYTRKS